MGHSSCKRSVVGHVALASIFKRANCGQNQEEQGEIHRGAAPRELGEVGVSSEITRFEHGIRDE